MLEVLSSFSNSQFCIYHRLFFFMVLPYVLIGIFRRYVYKYIYSCLGPHLQHVEVPRLGVQSELQLPAYTTATATWDPSRLYDLHHSSQPRQILNLSGDMFLQYFPCLFASMLKTPSCPVFLYPIFLPEKQSQCWQMT